MKKFLATTSLVLLAGTTTAEADNPVAIRGGLICDTLEQVIESIKTPGVRVEGCGVLVRVMLATVTELEPYEHNGLLFLLAKYEFQANVNWRVQYGFWGAPIPVDGQPEPAESLL